MVRSRPPSACTQGAPKGLQATNRALDARQEVGAELEVVDQLQSAALGERGSASP
jgi:hypothetical protein